MEQKITQLKVKLPVGMLEPKIMVAGTRLVADRLSALAHQFFLAYINTKRKAKRRDGNYTEPSDWFTVNSRILKGIGSSNYSQYVTILMANRVIEARLNDEGTESYLPGHRSKQYRFIPPMGLEGKLSFTEHTITDIRTIKSILATRDAFNDGAIAIQQQGNQPFLVEGVREFLTKSLAQLELDSDLAKAIISDLPVKEQELQEQFLDNLSHHFVFDRFGLRLHTWLTSLNKKLRPALKFEDEGSLCIIDIANSQPYFASVSLQPDIACILLPQEFQVVQKYFSKSIYTKFMDDCLTGQIYDFFVTELDISRDEVKQAFFQGVLFRKRLILDDRAKAVAGLFKKRYSNVDKLFTRLRNLKEDELEPIKQSLQDNTMKSYNKFRKHKLLPLLMQRAESRMVFNHIIPALMKAGIRPVVTIHDSFILPTRFLETAILVIEQSFKDIGVESPSLTSKILC